MDLPPELEDIIAGYLDSKDITKCHSVGILPFIPDDMVRRNNVATRLEHRLEADSILPSIRFSQLLASVYYLLFFE